MKHATTPLIDITCDGHVHTALCCHAVGAMEEYVRAAIDRGLSGMCFLEHLEAGINSPHRTWLTDADFDAYFAEGERLRAAYAGQIEIRLGAEMGCNPEAADELEARLARWPFERVGLSCHFHRHEGIDYKLLSRHPESLDVLTAVGVDRVLAAYLDTLIWAVRRFEGNVLCHLDAGLRHLPGVDFSTQRERVLALLEAVRERGMSLEINTSGVPLRDSPYPADWIVRAAIGMGIPLVPGSDAHAPEDVGRHFDTLPGMLAGLAGPR